MGRPIQYDRDEILAAIRERANSQRIYAMNQKALAEELGISQFHFNRIVKSFVDTGQLRSWQPAERRWPTKESRPSPD